MRPTMVDNRATDANSRPTEFIIKPVAPWLGVVKLENKEVTTILGISNNVQAPSILWQMVCVSFICGFSDSHTFLSRGVFSTMMTGNLVIVFDAIVQGNDSQVYVMGSVIALCGFMMAGVMTSFFVMRLLGSWEKSFGPILVILLGISAICAVMDTYWINEISKDIALFIYSAAIGSLSFWSSKCGYLVMLHTGNIMKIIEFMLKVCCQYNLGDEKSKGDIYVLTRLVMGFVSGVITSAFSYYNLTPGLRLVPCMIVIVVLLFLVYQKEIAFHNPKRRVVSSSKKAHTPVASPVHTPMQLMPMQPTIVTPI